VCSEVNPASRETICTQELHRSSRVRVREIGGRASGPGTLVLHSKSDILKHVTAHRRIDRAQLEAPLPKTAIARGPDNSSEVQSHSNMTAGE
jgi:hypothetical protein